MQIGSCLDWKGLLNVHILFCLYVYIKHQGLLICNENKRNLCCQFDDTIEVYFLLGINIWGLRSEWVNAMSGKPQAMCIGSNLILLSVLFDFCFALDKI